MTIELPSTEIRCISGRSWSILAFLLVSAGVACATPISNTTGLSSPTFVYTFGGPGGAPVLAANAPVTNEFPGINFSPQLYYDGNNGTGDGGCAYPNGNPNCLTNFITSSGPLADGSSYAPGLGIIANFEIDFSAVQTAAAFSLVTSDGDIDWITAYLQGVEVDSVAATSGTNGPYYGFQDELFDSIRVTTGGSNLALINNLEIGSTHLETTAAPESSASTLFFIGIAALVGWRHATRARLDYFA